MPRGANAMMEVFGKDIYSEPFIMFSTVHFVTLTVIILANAGFILFFRKCSSRKLLNIFRFSIAGLMLANEFSYIIWSIVSGDWSVDYSLPLQLCEALTFLSSFMLITDSYKAFEITYFITFAGALQALLTPDLYYPFPHYRFFNFFLSHGLMFTAVFYMIVVKGYKPRFISIFKTMLWLNIYMLVLIPVNLLTGGNYMFLCSKPVDGSILDYLGPWPWYLVSLEAVGLVLLLLCYAPYGLAAIFKSRNLGSGSQNISVH